MVFPYRPRQKAGAETVVVHCYCTYYAPLAYPGEIEVRTYAGSPGRSSFDIVQEIRRSDDPETVCAIGGCKVVWVDQANRQIDAASRHDARIDGGLTEYGPSTA